MPCERQKSSRKNSHVVFLAWVSRFGANHKLVSGIIQFEMPFSRPSGHVKKVTELGAGEGLPRGGVGLGIKIWDFLFI